MAELSVLNQKISYIKIDDEDYISITDMLKSTDGDLLVTARKKQNIADKINNKEDKKDFSDLIVVGYGDSLMQSANTGASNTWSGVLKAKFGFGSYVGVGIEHLPVYFGINRFAVVKCNQQVLGGIA